MKSAAEFFRCSARKDGLQNYCKSCHKLYNAKKYYDNHEERKAQLRDRRKADPEHWRKYGRDYYWANRDRVLGNAAAYWERNRDKCLARLSEYRKANPDLFKKYSDERRARVRGVATIPFSPGRVRQRWAYYGHKCWICGATAEETDHVKPLSKGGAHMPCNLRPICHRCNSRKRAKWPLTAELLERISA